MEKKNGNWVKLAVGAGGYFFMFPHATVIECTDTSADAPAVAPPTSKALKQTVT